MTGPSEALQKLSDEGLLRHLRPLDSGGGMEVTRDGRTLWNFGSNDYLGLARDPRVEDALIEGARRFGAGSTASRLVCGSLPPHQLLEEAIAEAKETEAALTFSSGFAAAVGVIPAVVGARDFVFLDKLSHACLVDGARLSGATLRVFPHNDLEKLSRLLVSTRAKSSSSRILVVTESVFSMDGDEAPLAAIVDLAEAHDALLLVDEAHAIGVLGASGMGLAEEMGLQHRIAFQMGTMGKALGLAGGYVAASRPWVDLLVNSARSFVFSTAPPPAISHACLTSLALVRSPEGRRLRQKLQTNIARLKSSFRAPIIPIMLGNNAATLEASARLEQRGFLIAAIRFPTVPRGTARLRISVSAAHPPEAVDRLAAALSEIPTPPQMA